MRGDSRTVKPVLNYERGSSAQSIRNFTGVSFTRTTSDFEDRIYLYTNIEEPKSRSFWKVHGSSVELTADGIATFPGVATGSSASPEPDNDTSTPQIHDYGEIRVSGSLGTTQGTFTTPSSGTWPATASARKIIIDPLVTFDGNTPTFVSGTWTFTPSNPRRPYQRTQDEEYLYFGIWASEPKDKDGAPAFRWIAGGGAEGPDNTSNIGNFSQLTGSAEFMGGVVGQYAIDKTASGGTADIGTFTANAKFDASFNVEGEDNDNKISGSITSFKKEGGSELSGTLYLGGTGDRNPPADLTAAGVAAVAGVSGTIDGVNVTGSWAARLYGIDNEVGTENANVPDGITCPNGCAADIAGVTGWFNAGDGTNAGGAGNDVVAIGGAFGAAKQ